MYLFVPMSFLPRILRWAIPLAIIAWHVVSLPTGDVVASRSWRPCLALLPSAAIVGRADPHLWSAAILALACRWPVLSWMLAFKPSVLPLAAGFVRDGRWWMGGVVVLVLAIPFGLQWLDYADSPGQRRRGSLLRSATAIPWLAIPVVAWLARTRVQAA